MKPQRPATEENLNYFFLILVRFKEALESQIDDISDKEAVRNLKNCIKVTEKAMGITNKILTDKILERINKPFNNF